MFTHNPFVPVAEFLAPIYLQLYVVLMILAVVAGTLLDLYHKDSARFFAQQRARARARATHRLGVTHRAVLAALTLAREVLTSGEFHDWRRRLSHLLLSWGFVLYLLATGVMVFGYPANPDTPALWPLLWNLGALMVLGGGGWFFFRLRVDVVQERRPPWRLVRADLFIGLLLASVSLGLLFEMVGWTGLPGATRLLFSLYLLFTTLLFATVPWSKFAHMFYKPVMAYQRRVEAADGSSHLPTPAPGRQPRS